MQDYAQYGLNIADLPCLLVEMLDFLSWLPCYSKLFYFYRLFYLILHIACDDDDDDDNDYDCDDAHDAR